MYGQPSGPTVARRPENPRASTSAAAASGIALSARRIGAEGVSTSLAVARGQRGDQVRHRVHVGGGESPARG